MNKFFHISLLFLIKELLATLSMMIFLMRLEQISQTNNSSQHLIQLVLLKDIMKILFNSNSFPMIKMFILRELREIWFNSSSFLMIKMFIPKERMEIWFNNNIIVLINSPQNSKEINLFFLIKLEPILPNNSSQQLIKLLIQI